MMYKKSNINGVGRNVQEKKTDHTYCQYYFVCYDGSGGIFYIDVYIVRALIDEILKKKSKI